MVLFHLFEHGDRVLKMLLEVFTHRIQNFEKQWIAQRIKNLVAILAGNYQMALPQYG